MNYAATLFVIVLPGHKRIPGDSQQIKILKNLKSIASKVGAKFLNFELMIFKTFFIGYKKYTGSPAYNKPSTTSFTALFRKEEEKGTCDM